MKAFVLSAHLLLTHFMWLIFTCSQTQVHSKLGAERRVDLNLPKTNHTCQKSHMSYPDNFALGSPVIVYILSLGKLCFGRPSDGPWHKYDDSGNSWLFSKYIKFFFFMSWNCSKYLRNYLKINFWNVPKWSNVVQSWMLYISKQANQNKTVG